MSEMFGSDPKPVATPAPTPMVDEAALKRAKTKTIKRVRSSGGRESTILGGAANADKSDKLGA